MKTTKRLETSTRARVKRKIRAKIRGTQERPRLSVYRSNKFIYAQVIDDSIEKTVVSASDVKIKSGTKTEKAIAVGKAVAEACKAKNIDKIVFDRNGFNYTGRLKALAESARNSGLIF